MKIIDNNKNEIIVSFTEKEFRFISNAINETLEIVEEWELDTRTGMTLAEAEELHLNIRQNIDLIFD